MKKLIVFQLSENQSIQTIIDELDKINIYGYESEGLHIFDEVQVEYVHNNQTILLKQDIVREVVEVFCNTLVMVLKNELLLDRSLTAGKVSYFYSKNIYMTFDDLEKADDIFPKYWVWSSSNIATWLYSLDSKIYLEISPTYPWLFLDPEQDDVYISFDEYTNEYKHIALVELPESLVRLWIDQCTMLLQTMETV